MRFATKDSKTQCNCNVQEHAKHIEAALTLRTTPRLGRTQPAPAAHRRYPSSPAAATWHGITQGFVPRLSPQHKPHATFMQPLQCVSQPKIPKHHETAMCRNTRNTSKQPSNCGLLQDLAEPSPHPPHTGSTPHRRLQPLDTEKHKVSCPGFLPKTKPMQQSCDHSTAFCSIMWLTRMYLVTTFLRHHFCKSPLPLATTSPSHYFPWSPLPLVTAFCKSAASLSHHFPKSPLPQVTTSLSHHFP